MKKMLTLLLTLLLLVPALTYADVILEPDNGFFRAHESECRALEGRTYIADGPEGTLPLYSAPGGTLRKSIPNGEAFFCRWAYWDKKGDVWGYSESHELWAPLGYTLVQYDHIAFEADHGDDFLPGDGRALDEELTAFVFYAYPGSPDHYPMDQIGPLTADELYVDEAGRTWGFVSYYYGWRNMWVCLDDPENEDLTGEAKAPLPSGYASPATLSNRTQVGVIVGIVGAVVLLSLGAVLLLFRKKRIA